MEIAVVGNSSEERMLPHASVSLGNITKLLLPELRSLQLLDRKVKRHH
jgi:hypothetical protein